MPQADHISAKTIDDALTLEIAATPKQYVYAIEEVSRVADVVVVKVDLDKSKDHGLDESLEGAAAWWPGPPKGFADVLSVDPERETINLRYVTPQPPTASDTLFVYPPLFLEALRDWWRVGPNAEAAIRWFEEVESGRQHKDSETLPSHQFPWLRRAQRDAFNLPAWTCAFLDGPPGTGKTTTLGAVLASYLIQHPGSRVMLLSTTNTAVDQALVAVDKALEKLPGTWPLRRKCKRLGHHYQARHYQSPVDRTHLLPTPDPALVKALAELESQRPDAQDIVAYSSWKRQVELLRAKLKTNLELVLLSSRLAAMTTCAAMFWTSALYQCTPFDLIVFDEASQVGLAYAMALATFGKRVLFAGDPAQLAPIVQSEHRQPRHWLGRSAFDAISPPPGSSVFLDEQSRMNPEICAVVSRLFYSGKLRVAEKESRDLVWQLHRVLRHERAQYCQQVVAITVPASSTWSQKYHGPLRYDSAKAVAGIVADLAASEDPNSILVLTPFRAQRALLRPMLRQISKNVSVSTVHKAQGSERRTVIFDPVDGTSNFLLGDQARRLVNVALSRAEARLVLMLSEADRQNLLFADAAFRSKTHLQSTPNAPGQNRSNSPTATPSPAEPIESYVRNPAFPRCLKGKKIEYKSIIGIVTHVSGNQFTIHPESGEDVIYHADFIKSILRGNGHNGGATRQTSRSRHDSPGEWPEKTCNNCGRQIRLVKTPSGWRPYELGAFVPHRCY